MIENVGLQELNPEDTGKGNPVIKSDLSIYGHVKAKLEVVVGGAELSIQELLSLKQGTVIKMLEEANAPFLLKLDGKLIATGSLVVVDDHFGFEISDIID